MPDEQERLLTEAGFCWDPATEAWHARYQEAAAWKQEHGSLDFPRKHPLETWLHRQQKLHEASRLPADRAALLHELGALASPPPEKHEEPPVTQPNTQAAAADYGGYAVTFALSRLAVLS